MYSLNLPLEIYPQDVIAEVAQIYQDYIKIKFEFGIDTCHIDFEPHQPSISHIDLISVIHSFMDYLIISSFNQKVNIENGE